MVPLYKMSAVVERRCNEKPLNFYFYVFKVVSLEMSSGKWNTDSHGRTSNDMMPVIQVNKRLQQATV